MLKQMYAHPALSLMGRGIPLMLASTLAACEVQTNNTSPNAKTADEAAMEVNEWMDGEIVRLDDPAQHDDLDEDDLASGNTEGGEIPADKNGGGGNPVAGAASGSPMLAHECTGGKPCVGIRRTVPGTTYGHAQVDLRTWAGILTDDAQPTNQWCFLSGLGGNLDDSLDAVYVDRGTGCIEMQDRDDGGAGTTQWRLALEKTGANLSSVSGEATCIPTSNFKRDRGAVLWPSTEFYTSLYGEGSSKVWAWKNDAATMISMVRGNFEGTGERVRVHMSGESNDFAQLEVHSGERFRHGGAAHDQTKQELDGSASSNSSRTYTLPRTDLGFCYLTRVSGDYDGGGEQIRIFPKRVSSFDGGREHWYLYVRAEGGSAHASVRCVAYDQTTPPDVIPL